MDTTFISIHDLTPQARLLYSSDSVIDVLGYTPEELVNRSCWDFFPPEELPYAQTFHHRKVTMDKAAVLVYCRVKAKNGEWIGCECCFTIVYDVMIVCTSRYRQDQRSHERALAAPVIRRLFTSSPKDPRYHMLSHLSTKFSLPAKQAEFEPRAALFLNRFTRTLTIMYATHGIKDVLGISAKTMQGKSFYFCVAENCLQDAIKCLEKAKANHSIAYLRFWYRDPRLGQPEHCDNDILSHDEDEDEEMTDIGDYEDTSEPTIIPEDDDNNNNDKPDDDLEITDLTMDADLRQTGFTDTRASSGDSGNKEDSHEAIFGESPLAESSASSRQSPERDDPPSEESIELEAVISCASDGLVVCLRRARPMVPHPAQRPGRRVYPNGLFAAPWAADPMLPPLDARPQAGYGNGFAPSLGPRAARHDDRPPPPHGPASGDFMAAIREQAIFAWALTGINGALADFGHGNPRSGSVPDGGLRVWSSEINTYDTTTNNGTSERHGAPPDRYGTDTDAAPRIEEHRAPAPGPPYRDDPPPYDPNERSQELTHSLREPNGHSPASVRPPITLFGDPGLSRHR